MQNNYIPPSVPRRGSGSGMTWGFVGCGGLVILCILGVAAFTVLASNNKGVQKILSNAFSAPQSGQKLIAVRGALRAYRAEHNNRYPATLQDLVPKYIDAEEIAALSTEDSRADYTQPAANALPTTPILTLYNGSGEVFGQQQSYYVRLLKDDRIVMDQVVRTTLIKANSEEVNSPY